jgi:hypothetical protein
MPETLTQQGRFDYTTKNILFATCATLSPSFGRILLKLKKNNKYISKPMISVYHISKPFLAWSKKLA